MSPGAVCDSSDERTPTSPVATRRAFPLASASPETARGRSGFSAPNDRKLAATNTKRGLCSRRTFFLHVDKWLLRRPLLVGGGTVERRNRDAVQAKVDTKLRDVVDHMVEAEAAEGG